MGVLATAPMSLSMLLGWRLFRVAARYGHPTGRRHNIPGAGTCWCSLPTRSGAWHWGKGCGSWRKVT